MTKYNRKYNIVPEIPTISQIQAWQNLSLAEKQHSKKVLNKNLKECYDIKDIVGIKESHARLLKNRGVKNSCVLASKYLENNTATHKVAKKLNIDFDTIKAWASMADLMRVPGIGGQYAHILYMANVSSRKELKSKNAKELYDNINAHIKTYTKVPPLHMIQEWINFLHK